MTPAQKEMDERIHREQRIVTAQTKVLCALRKLNRERGPLTCRAVLDLVAARFTEAPDIPLAPVGEKVR